MLLTIIFVEADNYYDTLAKIYKAIATSVTCVQNQNTTTLSKIKLYNYLMITNGISLQIS